MSLNESNAVDSIIYTISAVLSPFIGILVDMTGRNIVWVFVSTIITIASHLILAFTFINPWVAMILMGIGYSVLACALWPMVALVIPEHQLGTAYGIMQFTSSQSWSRLYRTFGRTYRRSEGIHCSGDIFLGLALP